MTEGDVLNPGDLQIQINKSDVSLPPDKKYHVYFSYRDTSFDRDWVRKVVLSLEKEHGFICCEFSRDFVHGRSIIENINKCVSQSVKTVLVLSKEYLKSDWCKYEAEILLNLRIHTTEEILIPVIIDDIGYCDIPEHLRNIVYIDCRERKELWFPKLLTAIKRGKDPEIVDHNTNRGIFLDFSQNYSNLTTVHVETAIEANWYSSRRIFTRKYLPTELDMKGVALDLDTYNNIRRDLEQQHSLIISVDGFIFSCITVCYVSLCTLILVCAVVGFVMKITMGIVAASIMVLVSTLYIVLVIVYYKQSKKKKKPVHELHLRTMKTLKRKLFWNEKVKTIVIFLNEKQISFYYYDWTPCMVYTEQKLIEKRTKNVLEIHDFVAEIQSDEDNLTSIREDAESLLLQASLVYITDLLKRRLDNGTRKRHCKRAICLCEYLEQKSLI